MYKNKKHTFARYGSSRGVFSEVIDSLANIFTGILGIDVQDIHRYESHIVYRSVSVPGGYQFTISIPFNA